MDPQHDYSGLPINHQKTRRLKQILRGTHPRLIISKSLTLDTSGLSLNEMYYDMHLYKYTFHQIKRMMIEIGTLLLMHYKELSGLKFDIDSVYWNMDTNLCTVVPTGRAKTGSSIMNTMDVIYEKFGDAITNTNESRLKQSMTMLHNMYHMEGLQPFLKLTDDMYMETLCRLWKEMIEENIIPRVVFSQRQTSKRQQSGILRRFIKTQQIFCSMARASLQIETTSDGLMWFHFPISPTIQTDLMQAFYDMMHAFIELTLRPLPPQTRFGRIEQVSLSMKTATGLLLIAAIILQKPFPDILLTIPDTEEIIFECMLEGRSSDDTDFRYQHVRQFIMGRRSVSRCPGFLVFCIRGDELVMAVSVWLRNIIDKNNTQLSAQEHALILKNMYFSRPEAVRNLSLRMHSYAAKTFKQMVIVCSPYPTMAEIFRAAHDKKKIDITQDHSFRPVETDCVIYGESMIITNDEKLQDLWDS